MYGISFGLDLSKTRGGLDQIDMLKKFPRQRILQCSNFGYISPILVLVQVEFGVEHCVRLFDRCHEIDPFAVDVDIGRLHTRLPKPFRNLLHSYRGWANQGF